jgi:hypothetical protein
MQARADHMSEDLERQEENPTVSILDHSPKHLHPPLDAHRASNKSISDWNRVNINTTLPKRLLLRCGLIGQEHYVLLEEVLLSFLQLLSRNKYRITLSSTRAFSVLLKLSSLR